MGGISKEQSIVIKPIPAKRPKRTLKGAGLAVIAANRPELPPRRPSNRGRGGKGGRGRGNNGARGGRGGGRGPSVNNRPVPSIPSKEKEVDLEAESKKAADLETKKAADLETKKAADLADEQAAAAEKAKLEAMSAEEAEQLKIKKEQEEAVLAEAKAKKDKIAADKAEFLRQQQEKKLEALESGLKTAMADVQNPNQFDRVKKQLGLLLNSPVCEPDGRDKAIINEEIRTYVSFIASNCEFKSKDDR